MRGRDPSRGDDIFFSTRAAHLFAYRSLLGDSSLNMVSERNTYMDVHLRDVRAVREIIDLYVKGSAGDVELLRSIFHSDALMNGYFEGELGIGSPEPFFAEVAKLEGGRSAEGYAGEIESVEVVGDVATARLVETGFMGSDFVDFFHLIRVGGEWKIISKTYHHQAQA